MKLKTVKGTKDIVPEEMATWRLILAKAEEILSRAGVQQLMPPTFEYTEVFTKSAGDSSDLVVQKEMYTFEDSGGRSLTLRPEFTAGVMRAFIEHGMASRPSPIKLWSWGPVFRAERQPQRGRFRQFHQLNCEFLGLDTPFVDAEAVALLYQMFTACGVKNMIVKLGSVGDPEDRIRYNQYLQEALAPHESELSEQSKVRLCLNPMRILDSKDAHDQEMIAELKRPLDFLNDEARAHFEAVREMLEHLNIPLEIDDAIVRGLDYYRRTAFEIHHLSIGSQSALCGGGRYDGLIESMGGPTTPGIGWAFGIERVIDALHTDNAQIPPPSSPLLFFVPLDDEAVPEVMQQAHALRAHTTVLHSYTKRKPGKGLQEASKAGAHFAGLRGNNERARGVYMLKNLASGEQHEVLEADLPAFLNEHH